MVPKPNIERGREIDCYLDSRPVETARINDSPAIDQSEETKMETREEKERELREAQKRFREERQKRIAEGKVTVEEWLTW
jgi:hypothetical protein